MSKSTLYDLWLSILEVGKASIDMITGQTTEDAIINEIKMYRIFTTGFKTEPRIVLEALRSHNELQKYGISDDEFREILKNYLQKGLKSE